MPETNTAPQTERNGDEASQLYRKWRPARWADVVGQPDAVRQLSDMVKARKVPHAIMLTGPSGTGKTTMVRIMQKKLQCAEADYAEEDCAAWDEPINVARRIKSRIGISPRSGKCRIWFFEEVQSLSRTSHAQQALLNMLEETPSHVYFFLATTDPEKVIKAIRTRCEVIALKPLSITDLTTLVKTIADKEGLPVKSQLIDQIVQRAEGSARTALNDLQKALRYTDDAERLAALAPEGVQKKAFDLVKALLWQQGRWDAVAKILKDVKEGGEDPEMVRRLVMANAADTAMKAKDVKSAGTAGLILETFRDPMYNAGRNGFNGLVWACLEVVRGRGG